MPNPAHPKSMELEGTLNTFPLPDLLRFLAMGKMTGVLELEHDDRQIEIRVKDGQIVGTASPDRYCKLGEMLVSNSIITRHDLVDALQCQREEAAGRMLGELLIERKLVSSEQIERILSLQVREELWELFTWDDGQFKFEHGATPGVDHVMVTIDIDALISEGTQCAEQFRQIWRNLNDLQAVYRVRADVSAIPERQLTPNNWKVLSLINGRSNIHALIHQTGLGRFETLSSLDVLINMELVERVQQRGQRKVDSNIRIMEAPFKPNGKAAQGERNADHDTSAPGAAEARRGLSGLFGKRRREDGPDAPARRPADCDPAHRYPTSVAMASDLVTKLVYRLAEEAEFAAEHDPVQLLSQIWGEQTQSYPRADLVALREGRLNSTIFDRYVETSGGIVEPLSGTHEDTMAALAASCRHLRALARECLGERADELINKLAQPFIESSAVEQPNEFMPRTWAMQWMYIHNAGATSRG